MWDPPNTFSLLMCAENGKDYVILISNYHYTPYSDLKNPFLPPPFFPHAELLHPRIPDLKKPFLLSSFFPHAEKVAPAPPSLFFPPFQLWDTIDGEIQLLRRVHPPFRVSSAASVLRCFPPSPSLWSAAISEVRSKPQVPLHPSAPSNTPYLLCLSQAPICTFWFYQKNE